MGSNQAYNAILAKARAMYGRRLTAQNYQDLLGCRDLPEVLNYLKSRTPYGAVLQEMNSLLVRRAQIEAILRQNLLNQYASFCRYEMTIGHEFYRYFILYGEIQQILNRLHELHSKDKAIDIQTRPDFIVKHNRLNRHAIHQATDVQMLVLALAGTPYAKVIGEVASKPDFSLEANGILELEAALERFFYGELAKIARKATSGKEQEEVLYMLGRQSDLKAIEDIYRLKSVLNADAELVERCICKNVTNITKKQWEYLINAETAKDVLQNLIHTPYAHELYGTEFTYVEDWIRKADYIWHRKQLRFSTYPSIVLFCYIFLAENELANVIHIIEAVRYGLPQDEISQVLLGVGD